MYKKKKCYSMKKDKLDEVSKAVDKKVEKAVKPLMKKKKRMMFN